MELFQISPQAGYPPFWSTNRTELFGLIARGKYSLPEQEWKSISDGAKRLIKSMVRNFFRGRCNIVNTTYGNFYTPYLGRLGKVNLVPHEV